MGEEGGEGGEKEEGGRHIREFVNGWIGVGASPGYSGGKSLRNVDQAEREVGETEKEEGGANARSVGNG